MNLSNSLDFYNERTQKADIVSVLRKLGLEEGLPAKRITLNLTVAKEQTSSSSIRLFKLGENRSKTESSFYLPLSFSEITLSSLALFFLTEYIMLI